MNVDIINVFWTSYVQKDEQHPGVIFQLERFWEKAKSSLRIKHISPEIYLDNVLAVLAARKGAVDAILNSELSVEEIQKLKEFYTRMHKLSRPSDISIAEWVHSQEYKTYETFLWDNHSTIAPIEKKVERFVDTLVGSHVDNPIVNYSSESIDIVWRVSDHVLVTINGNPNAANGHGAFRINGFAITNSEVTMTDENYPLTRETLSVDPRKSTVWYGIYQYEDILNGYAS